jgi:ABC-type multidrug transport system fused ATPase/permease subunit
MKKTRKIKNKKIFLKWLKKSRRNKYNITSGGTRPTHSQIVIDQAKTKVATAAAVRDAAAAAAATDAADNEANEKPLYTPPKKSVIGKWFNEKLKKDRKAIVLKDETTKAKNVALALAVSTSLADMALSITTSPVAKAVFVGIGITGAVATNVALGGLGLVLLGVIWYAATKTKAAFGNYYKMVHVMNNLMLLLKRIHNVLMVAIKISSQYNFIFDTKDINNSLENILKKFDKILSVEGKKDIAKEISKDISANNVNFVYEEKVEEVVASEKIEEDDIEKITASKSGILKKAYLSISSTYNTLRFNADEFSKELNEEITKLALYFSIFLGEFNILFNVSQVTELTNRNASDEKNAITVSVKNDQIKNDINFKEVLMSTLLYRILQIHNMFELCKRKRFQETLCSPLAMEGYVKEVVMEMKKINTILNDINYNPNDKVYTNRSYPLYTGEMFMHLKELLNKNKILRGDIVTIESKDRAQQFCAEIADFNKKISTEFHTSSST